MAKGLDRHHVRQNIAYLVYVGSCYQNEPQNLCLFLPVVLVVGVVFLLMATGRLDGISKRLHIFRQKQITTTCHSITALCRHRYNTSFEA